ncbi:MAG: hypothetical protein Q8O67_05740 [Deltaproteobacteria bacterium]|nr:hypothetical protein [Deltaproteobacteria bacterium]
MVHEAEQPSPSSRSASSHSSASRVWPSPQGQVQNDGSPRQDHSGSIEQSARQPSPSSRPPSSQASRPPISPSPQIEHSEGSPAQV